ncbi:hypothetical protein DUNSADRAFT_3921 [Dunaliella salina]|uniref:DNA-directed DNA polymerase family A palm domain-containing protein n=1 Tax=Dunaliella salina TaxID=3046 RepID=A0ABQ7FV24_DUNSA|nr:hypothetical protein DUNSADRAFT_3921 [Dunaliella salina]|eukprot:KAF5826251.1 hypothetical protein DUNSADRAFT_3921 [Dunaliella salina]
MHQEMPSVSIRAVMLRAQLILNSVMLPAPEYDQIKFAMVKLHDTLDNSPEWAGTIKLVLMFHDELVYEMPEGCVSKAAPHLKNVLENAWPLCVPTPVDIKCGPDWGHLSKWNG